MHVFARQQLQKLNSHGYSSLVDVFSEACQKDPAATAFVCLDQSISFAQLDNMSAQFAAYLRADCGLAAGDRIAVQLPNMLQYPVAVWGAWRAGLVVVNTNPLYTLREQLHQFNDSGAVALVVFEDLLPVTEKVVPETGIKTVIVTNFAEMVSDTLAYKATKEGFVSYSDALASGADVAATSDAEISMDDIAVLQYTGGTTGPSKGAMLTHGNLFGGMALSRKSVVLSPPEVTEIAVCPLPLYHVFAFTQNVVAVCLEGGYSVLIPDPRDVGSIISAMKAHPFTLMNGVNTLFSGLMAHPDFDTVDYSTLNGVISGGTTLVKEIGEAWEARTQSDIYEGYGLSETTAVAACNRPESKELGTVGLAMDYQEIKIVSDTGKNITNQDPGEIYIRGPQVMIGYWGNEQATADSIDSDGWFQTGDVGVLQENGHLKIVDRIKDMIIVSGFNVYPNEVEAVVYGHSDIRECAAIGVPDDATGEAIKLFVVSSNPELQASDIIDFCRAELTAYKVPKQIVFSDDLPKSPAGKVLRRELRDT